MQNGLGVAKLRMHATITAVICLLGGCALLPFFTTREPAPPFDFARLQTCVNLAVDVTAVNAGLQTREQVRAIHDDPETRLEFIEVGGVNIVYMLLTSDADRRHTLVLPGTSNLIHILLDLQRRRVFDEELGVNLHAGFRKAAMAVRADAAARLDSDYEIHVVGYSFGGATAAILSAYLRVDGFNVADLLTLGQPACTDPAGASAFDELPLLRLISGDDAIVWGHPSSFAQFGEAIILLDGPYIVHIEPDDPEFDVAAGLLVGMNDDGNVDHGLYIPRIRSKVGVDVYEVRFLDRLFYLQPSWSLR